MTAQHDPVNPRYAPAGGACSGWGGHGVKLSRLPWPLFPCICYVCCLEKYYKYIYLTEKQVHSPHIEQNWGDGSNIWRNVIYILSESSRTFTLIEVCLTGL